MNLEKQPTWLDAFSFFLLVAMPGYAIYYAISTYNYISQRNPHIIISLAEYTKISIKFLVAGYSFYVAYLAIQKNYKFAMHSKLFLFILLLSPFLWHIPYLLLDLFVTNTFPSPVLFKQLAKEFIFTVPISLIWFGQLGNMVKTI